MVTLYNNWGGGGEEILNKLYELREDLKNIFNHHKFGYIMAILFIIDRMTAQKTKNLN